MEAIHTALEDGVEQGDAVAVLHTEVGCLHVDFADGVNRRIVIAGICIARLLRDGAFNQEGPGVPLGTIDADSLTGGILPSAAVHAGKLIGELVVPDAAD